jgi:hypothetical protein
MSETIWSFRVGGSIAGKALTYGFIAFLALLLLLVALTSPPQYRLNNALGMAIFLAPLIAAALVIDRGFFEAVRGQVHGGRAGRRRPEEVLRAEGCGCWRRRGLYQEVTRGPGVAHLPRVG